MSKFRLFKFELYFGLNVSVISLKFLRKQVNA